MITNIDTIQWTGDLSDDATAIVGDYTLRAEVMNKADVWWRVSSQDEDFFFDSSTEGVRAESMQQAMWLCEQVVMWVVIHDYFDYMFHDTGLQRNKEYLVSELMHKYKLKLK